MPHSTTVEQAIDNKIAEKELNYTGDRIRSIDILKELNAPLYAHKRFMYITGRIFRKRGWKKVRQFDRDENGNRKIAWEFNVIDGDKSW